MLLLLCDRAHSLPADGLESGGRDIQAGQLFDPKAAYTKEKQEEEVKCHLHGLPNLPRLMRPSIVDNCFLVVSADMMAHQGHASCLAGCRPRLAAASQVTDFEVISNDPDSYDEQNPLGYANTVARLMVRIAKDLWPERHCFMKRGARTTPQAAWQEVYAGAGVSPGQCTAACFGTGIRGGRPC